MQVIPLYSIHRSGDYMDRVHSDSFASQNLEAFVNCSSFHAIFCCRDSMAPLRHSKVIDG